MPYLGNSPQNNIRQRYYYTATGGQTLFTGADDNGTVLKYQDNKYLDVYLNGVLLQDTIDYTALTKSSVTLLSGATAGDLVEIVAYGVFSVADTVSASLGGTFSGNVDFTQSVSVTGNLKTGGTNSANGVFIGRFNGYPSIELVGPNSAGGLIDFTMPGEDFRGRIVYFNTANTMNFLTAGQYRLVIDGTGNTGIGTTSPTALLHLNKGSTAANTDYIRIQMPSWAGSTNYLKNITWSDQLNDVASVGAYFDGSSVNMKFHSFYNSGYKTSNDAIMTLMGTGNIGVGTNTPSKKFVVSNNSTSGLEISPLGRSDEMATSLLSYNRATSAFIPAQYDANTHQFMIGTVERMRIDASGNVAITGSLTVSNNVYATTFSGSAASLNNLYNKGIEVLSPGSSIRWRNDTGVNVTETKGTLTTYTLILAPIMQFGTIRVSLDITSAGSGVKVYLIESGTGIIFNLAVLPGTLLATYTTTGTKTLDVSVTPGDVLHVIGQAQSNTLTVTNCRLQTNGEDLWASSIPTNYVLGFDGNKAP